MNNINRKPQNNVKFISFGIAFLVLMLTSVIVVSTSYGDEFDAPSGAPTANGASPNPVSINETVSQTIHLNPSHSSASDSNAGTSDRPVKTLERAIYLAREANKKKINVKVLVYPGMYRETVSYYGNSGATTIIEAKEPGKAIVSGSEIWTGWSSQGNNTYTRNWPYDWGYSGVPGDWSSLPDNPSVPNLLRRREMIVADGKNLGQVLNSSELANDTFYVDEKNNRITIKLSSSKAINDQLVEVAVRDRVFMVSNSQNVIVRGMVFQHTNNHFHTNGVWMGDSKNLLVDNNIFRWNGAIGFGFNRITNMVTRKNQYLNNGTAGSTATLLKNYRSEDEIARYNNWRGVRAGYIGWFVAGVKHLFMRDSTYVNLETCYNHAHGLWLDTDNRNMLVENLFSCNNDNTGLYIEANPGPITVRNSIIANNKREGVRGANSEGVRVENNIFYGNDIAQIYFSGDNNGRWIEDSYTGQSIKLDPGENWTVRDNIAIGKNNNHYVWEFTYSSGPLDVFKRTADMDNNTLYHRTKSSGFRVSGGQLNFDGYKSKLGREYNSKYQDVCFRNPDNNDFTRCDGSSPIPTPKPGSTSAPQPTSQPTAQSTSQPNPNGPKVVRLVLIDADSDKDLREIKDGDIIDLKSLPSPRINVRAETNPATVGSVKFDLNNSVRVENGAPYALYSDDYGNYAGMTPNLGDYTLKVTAYTQSYQGGTAGEVLTVRYKVVNDGSGGGTQPTSVPPTSVPPTTAAPTATPQPSTGLNVVSFTLVNADTNQDILTLAHGSSINIKSLPTRNLSVRANTNPGTVGSVIMKLNTYQTTENMQPYSLYGDENGDYYGRSWATGDYTMYGLAYSKSNQTGTSGQPITVNFKLVDGSTTGAQPTTTPQPTKVPSTSVPPTKVPSTAVPPTAVPPTPQPATGPSVTSFTLIDGNTDRDIRTIVDGETLNLAELPSKLNIRANTNPSMVGSVLFVMNDYRSSENGAPYAIYGDENGDYYGVGFKTGNYTLSGTAYTRANNSGVAGRTLTVRFNMVWKEQSQPTNTSTPKPVQPKPTTVPPTNVPPTAVPPTVMPTISIPTNVPPTTVPPTTVPPTALPPIGSGTGLTGQYFNTADLTGDFLLRMDSFVGFNWDMFGPIMGINQDFFSVRWTGWVEPQYTETYTFYTYADDGTRLWINGTPVINDWNKHWVTEVSGTITLNAGQRYEIKLEYYDDVDQARVDLLWSSSRTTKQLIPMSQLYPAQITVPPILPTVEPLPTIELPTAVPPTVEPIEPMPTFELPTAVPTVEPLPTSVAPAPIPDGGNGLSGEYFNTVDFTGAPLLRIDPMVNFNWEMAEPMPTMPVDFFSVRWTGWVEPQYSETYTFYTFADDGTRLWINGIQIIDDWSKHWVQEASGTITLEAGQRYDIRLEYYDDNDHARVDLLWSSPSTPKQLIPMSQLYPAPVVVSVPPIDAPLPIEPLPTIGLPGLGDPAPIAPTPEAPLPIDLPPVEPTAQP